MGRHAITLTEAQKAEVETLAAVLSAEQVADYFGIGRTTFFAMIAKDPDMALLHKSVDGRGFPFPGRTYPTTSVTGMPSAV
jgi:hypothetical protein